MNLEQFAVFMITNIAFMLTLWLWSRSESRQDQRFFEGRVEAILQGIREEMKDFHGRLCAIEERRKGHE